MDVLFVIGAMLGLDGMELSPARSKELLAAACAAGADLACDGSWYADGRVDLPALAASARPRCEAKDPVGCAALGMAETRTAVGGLARTAPTWDAGQAHLAEACAAGVARACTEDSRIAMLIDPATTPEAVNLAPHRQLASGCAAGEPVACLLSADILYHGWGDDLDPQAADRLRARACAAGVPAACALADAPPQRRGELCAAGSRAACVALVKDGAPGGDAPLGALDLVRQGCDHRDEDSCRTIGSREDLPWRERVGALVQGCESSSMACLDLAALLRPAISTSQVQKLDTSCTSGDAVACHEVGWRAIRSLDGEEDLPALERAFRRACDAGLAASCRELATLQGQGLATAADERAILATYGRACDGGSQNACSKLAAVADSRGAVPVGQALRAAAAGLGARPYPAIRWERMAGGDVSTTQTEVGSAAGVVEVASADVRVKSRVKPSYPTVARSAKLDEACVVQVLIGVDGVPESVTALRCHTYLIGVTEVTALKWRFRPVSPDFDFVLFNLTVSYRMR